MSREDLTGKGCEQVSALLSPYLDGEVNTLERAQVEGHIASCTHCREELKSLEQTSKALKMLPVQPVPRSFAIPASQPITSGHMLWFGRMRLAGSVAAVFLVALVAFDLFGQANYYGTSDFAAGQPAATQAQSTEQAVAEATAASGEKTAQDRSVQPVPATSGAAPAGRESTAVTPPEDAGNGAVSEPSASSYVVDPNDPLGGISSATQEPVEQGAPADETASSMQRSEDQQMLFRVGEGFLAFIIVAMFSSLLILRRTGGNSTRR